jgi:hypothetical protein
MPRKTVPEADGFGKYGITGGEYGQVLFINDLTDASSRSAWRSTFPRMIIPRVSGYVEMNSNISPSYSSRKDFTFLGILAPGKFIYKNWEIRIASTENFIIRGLEGKTGDRNGETSSLSGDAFTFADITNFEPCKNFYIDYSLAAWSTDELFSISNATNGTVQNCLFFEPLNYPTIRPADQGGGNTPHGFGHLIGSKQISFHHNLMAYYWSRMPAMQNRRGLSDPTMDFRNNVLYAWHRRSVSIEGTTGGGVRNTNWVKNLHIRKTPYSGESSSGVGLCRWSMRSGSGLTPDENNTPRIYMQGNKLVTYNNGQLIDIVPTLDDTPASQRELLFADPSSYNNTWRNTVGVLEQYSLDLFGGYEFDETPFQSLTSVTAKAGPLVRDNVDKRVIIDVLTGRIPTKSSLFITEIEGLIDQPNDSLHVDYDFANPANPDNATKRGYPVIEAGENILNGPEPHFLPSWFTSKYNLPVTGFDYLAAGTPQANPGSFIIFGKADIGLRLSDYIANSGVPDYDNDAIYRTYSVLGFYQTGEINLLETPDYSLTVQKVGNGTTNIISGSYPVSTSVNLIATPDSGWLFSKWEQLVLGDWEEISLLSNFNFLMPNQNTTVRAVFIEDTDPPIPPIIATGDRFFARRNPIA